MERVQLHRERPEAGRHGSYSSAIQGGWAKGVPGRPLSPLCPSQLLSPWILWAGDLGHVSEEAGEEEGPAPGRRRALPPE